MSSPLGLRFFRISQRASTTAARIPIRKPLQRRFQSTEVPPPSSASARHPQNAFQRLWNSPVGAKTVHFWLVFQHLILFGRGGGAEGLPTCSISWVFYCDDNEPELTEVFVLRAPVMKVCFI